MWVTGWVGRRRRRNFVVILPRRVSFLSRAWFFGYLEKGEGRVREEGRARRHGKGRQLWYLSNRFHTGSDHGGLSCWSSAGVQERWIQGTWSDLLDDIRDRVKGLPKRRNPPFYSSSPSSFPQPLAATDLQSFFLPRRLLLCPLIPCF